MVDTTSVPDHALAPRMGEEKTLFWLVGVLVVLSVVNLILGIMAKSNMKAALSKHSDELNLLTRRMDTEDERYAVLRGQFEVTSERLGLSQEELARAQLLAADLQEKQWEVVRQLNDAIAMKASAEEVDKLQADANSKFGSLSGDLARARKDLENTQAALTGATSELSGAIARTHDELVALARKTDRDFFVVHLSKKRPRHKVGTVMIELEKTNPNRNTFTVNLFLDDRRIQRRDKAVYEPVFFFLEGASSPLELVVNELEKGAISGYLSTPKGLFSDTTKVLSARPGM